MERLETLPALAFWGEPLEVLKHGVEFLDAARAFIRETTERIGKLGDAPDTEGLTESLSLALRAFFGVAALSASSDLLLESLTYFSKAEHTCPRRFAEVLGKCSASLSRHMAAIEEQLA